MKERKKVFEPESQNVLPTVSMICQPPLVQIVQIIQIFSRQSLQRRLSCMIPKSKGVIQGRNDHSYTQRTKADSLETGLSNTLTLQDRNMAQDIIRKTSPMFFTPIILAVPV